MSDLYILGALPWWLVALIAGAAAALLVRQFINLRERLSRGQTTFLTLVRTCVYAGLIFFSFGSGSDRQAGYQASPAAHVADRYFPKHGFSR